MAEMKSNVQSYADTAGSGPASPSKTTAASAELIRQSLSDIDKVIEEMKVGLKISTNSPKSPVVMPHTPNYKAIESAVRSKSSERRRRHNFSIEKPGGSNPRETNSSSRQLQASSDRKFDMDGDQNARSYKVSSPSPFSQPPMNHCTKNVDCDTPPLGLFPSEVDDRKELAGYRGVGVDNQPQKSFRQQTENKLPIHPLSSPPYRLSITSINGINSSNTSVSSITCASVSSSMGTSKHSSPSVSPPITCVSPELGDDIIEAAVEPVLEVGIEPVYVTNAPVTPNTSFLSVRTSAPNEDLIDPSSPIVERMLELDSQLSAMKEQSHQHEEVIHACNNELQIVKSQLQVCGMCCVPVLGMYLGSI